MLYRRDPNLQRGSRLNVGGTFDTTAPDGEINKAALSTDDTDGGKRTAKFDVKPEVLSLLHDGTSHGKAGLPLYIPDRTQFHHLFCNSRTIDGFNNFGNVFVSQACLFRQARHRYGFDQNTALFHLLLQLLAANRFLRLRAG